MKYTKVNKLSILQHSELNEKWVQDRIAEDPSILGLGDVSVKDKERIQPGGGRLDLLLEAEENKRFEVEILLGETDPSHIIRTIEYWDREKRRSPQFDHVAVIVAEDITSRFLHVIGLFNRAIPLIAIQMSALHLGDSVSLVFTTVMDLRHVPDEDEEAREVTDRSYWENVVGTKATVAMADELLGIVRGLAQCSDLELKYNGSYIGLAKDGRPNNFVEFRPQKVAIRVDARIPKSEDIDKKIENAGLDVMPYDAQWRHYRVRLRTGEVKKHEDVLRQLFEAAHRNSRGAAE